MAHTTCGSEKPTEESTREAFLYGLHGFTESTVDCTAYDPYVVVIYGIKPWS